LLAAVVEQAAQPLGPIPGLDPLELADGQLGASRPLVIGDLLRQGQLE
jgi:hypothetical protein